MGIAHYGLANNLLFPDSVDELNHRFFTLLYDFSKVKIQY